MCRHLLCRSLVGELAERHNSRHRQAKKLKVFQQNLQNERWRIGEDSYTGTGHRLSTSWNTGKWPSFQSCMTLITIFPWSNYTLLQLYIARGWLTGDQLEMNHWPPWSTWVMSSEEQTVASSASCHLSLTASSSSSSSSRLQCLMLVTGGSREHSHDRTDYI